MFFIILVLDSIISFAKKKQKLVCSPDVDKFDMKRTMEQAIKANGLETEIRNIVYHLLRASNKTDTKNPVQCVKCDHVKEKDFFSPCFPIFLERFFELSAASRNFMGEKSSEIFEFNVYWIRSYITRTAANWCWTRRFTEQMGWIEQLSNRFAISLKLKLFK